MAERREVSGMLPDPAAIWAVLRRRWLAFVLPIAMVATATAAYLLLATPLYRAAASLVIEPRRIDMVTTSANMAAAPLVQPGTDEVDTEAQIIGSASIAGRVAASLHLDRYPEYALAGAGFDPAQPASTHPLAPLLLRHVAVRREGLTYVIAITATSRDPLLAARIANEFARQYLLDREQAKLAATRHTGRFLTGRLDQLRQEAVAADEALKRYTIAHGLVSAEGATMAEQEVSQLNAEIAKARADHAEKAGRLAAARAQIGRGGGGADTQTALESATISDLRGKEADASRRLADLTSRYGDLHPEVVRTRQELADIRQQIAGEIARITSSLQAEASIAASRLASLEASQGRAAGSLAANNAAQVGLLELQRRAEGSGAIYQAYLARSKETISREGLTDTDARIGTVARVPRLPFSPDVPLIVVAALFGGLLAGAACAALADHLDGTIGTRRDVERRLRVRYAGTVPELRSTLGGARADATPQDYLVGQPASQFAEAFRGLRTVLATRDDTGTRVIAITSALPREGKSTTAICLARSFAATQQRTVLVDCDIRRRSVGEALLAPQSDGLLRYLAGAASLDTVLADDPLTGLRVLASTVTPDPGRDLFTAATVERMLADLRERFDVVILDTAPVLALAETRELAAAADAVLMVARWRTSAVQAVDTAIDLLLAAKVTLRGLALTRVDARRFAGSGVEDVYGYHRQLIGYYRN